MFFARRPAYKACLSGFAQNAPVPCGERGLNNVQCAMLSSCQSMPSFDLVRQAFQLPQQERDLDHVRNVRTGEPLVEDLDKLRTFR